MSRPDEAAAFWAGVVDGEDPQPPDSGIAAGAEAVTQKTSGWFHAICRTCGHTFRRGDRVVRDADTGEVRHLDPRLRCGTTEIEADTTDSEADAFAAGMLEAWPPADHVGVVTLTADHWQVARPMAGFRPPVCMECGHTFRAGESVVICPCRPHRGDERGGCGAAIHRDPAAGLPCWERWRPTGDLAVCPVRHTRVRLGGEPR